MAEQPLSLNIEYFPDPTKGKPVYNGSVYIGQPDLDPAVEANRASVTLIQEDGTRVTIAPAAQPLTTGAGGTVLYLGSPVVVLVDGVNSVKVLNNAGSQVYYAPRANESATVNQNEGVLVINGSFENETQLTGAPDFWTLNSSVNGSIAIDSTDQAHGLKSLKFTGTDATGSGTATSSRFNVLAGGSLDVRFTYKSSAVDTLNKVDIKYYNAAGAVVTTTNLHSEGAANPATYISYIKRATAPATAIQAEVIITGVDAAGATTIGTTNFDGVYADDGSYTITKTIAGADVASISINNLSFTDNKEITVDINTLNDAVGTAGNHEIVINGDTTATNYYAVNSIGGVSANNNQLTIIQGSANAENNTTLAISPNSTAGKMYIDITNVSFSGTSTDIRKASLVYTASSAITSIEIKTASGNLAFVAGSRMTLKVG